MSDVTVVQNFLNAFATGDVEKALGLLHDEVQVSEPAGLPTGGEYDGKPAFLGFLGKVAALYDVQVSGSRVIDGGDIAVAIIDSTWTAHATGARLATQYVELYTVEDGLITALNVFPKDTRALYELVQVPAPA
jgi:ketosteroid isomerase-like protein